MTACSCDSCVYLLLLCPRSSRRTIGFGSARLRGVRPSGAGFDVFSACGTTGKWPISAVRLVRRGDVPGTSRTLARLALPTFPVALCWSCLAPYNCGAIMVDREPLDSHLLRVLYVLLTERSVTPAAIRLHQSQPAIRVPLKPLRGSRGEPS